MRKNRTLTLVVIAIVLITLFFGWRSCQDDTYFPLDDISSAIPDNAAMVAAFDLPGIIRQVDYNEVSIDTSFQNSLSRAAVNNPIFSAILENPVSAGIETSDNGYFILIRDTTGQDQHLSALMFAIADVSKFEQTVLERKSYRFNITKTPSFSHVLIDQMTICGWNDQYMIIGATNVFSNLDEKVGVFFQSEQSNGVNKNKHFVSAMSRDDDVKFWLSLEPYAYDASLMGSMGMKGLSPSMAAGNYVTGGIDFKDGKIVGQADFQLDMEIQFGINKLFKNKNSKPFYQGLPEENIAFSFFASLNLPLIYQSAMGGKSTQKEVEAYLQKQGLDIDDLFKSLGGDILVNAYYPNDTSSLVDLFVVIDVSDETRIDKVLTWASRNGYMEKKGDQEYGFVNKWQKGMTSMNIGGNRELVLVQDEFRMIISNNFELSRNVLNGSDRAISKFQKDLVGQNQLAGYLNIGWLGRDSDDSIYDDLNFNLDSEGLDFQLNMIDKSSNSMKQLLTGK